METSSCAASSGEFERKNSDLRQSNKSYNLLIFLRLFNLSLIKRTSNIESPTSNSESAKINKPGPLSFHFRKPANIAPNRLHEIENLIRQGEAVGTKLVRDNIRNAYLIGYATEQGGKVIGTVTLKNPQEPYRKKLEKATDFNLSDYLERGYTSVAPDYRGLKVGDQLIKGLNRRSKGKKIYLTIRMDNTYALKLAQENNMALASTFVNERTGHEIGLFVNTIKKSLKLR